MPSENTPSYLSSTDILHIAVIKAEIETLRSRIRQSDTGHLHTAISVLEHRLVELQGS